VQFQLESGGSFDAQEVLYVSGLKNNLLSISVTKDKGVDIMRIGVWDSCGRYLPPRVNLTRIEYSGKQEETLMSWLITLEDLSAQEDNLY
jgi:hypothetical protein